MSEKKFKTVAFGGFDKEAVLVYLRNLLNEHEQTINQKNEELISLQSNNTSLSKQVDSLIQQVEALSFKCNQLTEEKNQFEKMMMIKEDKIDTQARTIDELKQHIEKMQAQTKQLIEETEKRNQLQMKEMEEQAQRKIEEAKQNAIDLFMKMDKEYRTHRDRYSDMVVAINELSRYIQEAETKANERLNVLPESLLK